MTMIYVIDGYYATNLDIEDLGNIIAYLNDLFY